MRRVWGYATLFVTRNLRRKSPPPCYQHGAGYDEDGLPTRRRILPTSVLDRRAAVNLDALTVAPAEGAGGGAFVVPDDAAALHEALKRGGIPHQDVADRLGCTRAAVTMQLSGRRTLQPEVVAAAEGLLRDRAVRRVYRLQAAAALLAEVTDE